MTGRSGVEWARLASDVGKASLRDVVEAARAALSEAAPQDLACQRGGGRKAGARRGSGRGDAADAREILRYCAAGIADAPKTQDVAGLVELSGQAIAVLASAEGEGGDLSLAKDHFVLVRALAARKLYEPAAAQAGALLRRLSQAAPRAAASPERDHLVNGAVVHLVMCSVESVAGGRGPHHGLPAPLAALVAPVSEWASQQPVGGAGAEKPTDHVFRYLYKAAVALCGPGPATLAETQDGCDVDGFFRTVLLAGQHSPNRAKVPQVAARLVAALEGPRAVALATWALRAASGAAPADLLQIADAAARAAGSSGAATPHSAIADFCDAVAATLPLDAARPVAAGVALAAWHRAAKAPGGDAARLAARSLRDVAPAAQGLLRRVGGSGLCEAAVAKAWSVFRRGVMDATQVTYDVGGDARGGAGAAAGCVAAAATALARPQGERAALTCLATAVRIDAAWGVEDGVSSAAAELVERMAGDVVAAASLDGPGRTDWLWAASAFGRAGAALDGAHRGAGADAMRAAWHCAAAALAATSRSPTAGGDAGAFRDAAAEVARRGALATRALEASGAREAAADMATATLRSLAAAAAPAAPPASAVGAAAAELARVAPGRVGALVEEAPPAGVAPDVWGDVLIALVDAVGESATGTAAERADAQRDAIAALLEAGGVVAACPLRRATLLLKSAEMPIFHAPLGSLAGASARQTRADLQQAAAALEQGGADDERGASAMLHSRVHTLRAMLILASAPDGPADDGDLEAVLTDLQEQSRSCAAALASHARSAADSDVLSPCAVIAGLARLTDACAASGHCGAARAACEVLGCVAGAVVAAAEGPESALVRAAGLALVCCVPLARVTLPGALAAPASYADVRRRARAAAEAASGRGGKRGGTTIEKLHLWFPRSLHAAHDAVCDAGSPHDAAAVLAAHDTHATGAHGALCDLELARCYAAAGQHVAAAAKAERAVARTRALAASARPADGMSDLWHLSAHVQALSQLAEACERCGMVEEALTALLTAHALCEGRGLALAAAALQASIAAVYARRHDVARTESAATRCVEECGVAAGARCCGWCVGMVRGTVAVAQAEGAAVLGRHTEASLHLEAASLPEGGCDASAALWRDSVDVGARLWALRVMAGKGNLEAAMAAVGGLLRDVGSPVEVQDDAGGLGSISVGERELLGDSSAGLGALQASAVLTATSLALASAPTGPRSESGATTTASTASTTRSRASRAGGRAKAARDTPSVAGAVAALLHAAWLAREHAAASREALRVAAQILCHAGLQGAGALFLASSVGRSFALQVELSSRQQDAHAGPRDGAGSRSEGDDDVFGDGGAQEESAAATAAVSPAESSDSEVTSPAAPARPGGRRRARVGTASRSQDTHADDVADSATSDASSRPGGAAPRRVRGGRGDAGAEEEGTSDVWVSVVEAALMSWARPAGRAKRDGDAWLHDLDDAAAEALARTAGAHVTVVLASAHCGVRGGGGGAPPGLLCGRIGGPTDVSVACAFAASDGAGPDEDAGCALAGLRARMERVLASSAESMADAPAPDAPRADRVAWWERRVEADADLGELIQDLSQAAEDVADRIGLEPGALGAPRPPLELLLDAAAQSLPWEATEAFAKFGVVRRVSLARAPALASLPAPRTTFSGPTTYLLNPSGDLSSTEAAFAPWFSRLPQWRGWAGTPAPDPAEVLPSLLAQLPDGKTGASAPPVPAFVYMGHGAGEPTVPMRQLRRAGRDGAVCRPALLVGCSSGRLRDNGEYDPSGPVLSYLLGGSATVVGALWDVTDKDIDRYARAVLERWIGPEGCGAAEPPTPAGRGRRRGGVLSGMSGGGGGVAGRRGRGSGRGGETYVADAVGECRGECKLQRLIGAAPVCYGTAVVVEGCPAPTE